MATTEESLRGTHDVLFGVARDFPPTAVTMPYLIMSSPRTGSSMLSSALRATKLAGHPLEYLHARNIAYYVKHTGKTRFDDFFSDLVQRRTSPNGVFGAKVQGHQHFELFGKMPKAGVAFVKVFRRFIRISRRDKVDQAISWMLALERNIWNSENPGEVVPERGFHPDDIAKIDALVVRAREADRYWDEIIAGLRLETVLRLDYEELRADSQREVARALAFIDVDVPVAEVPPPTTVKISGEGTRDIKREYLQRSGQAAA